MAEKSKGLMDRPMPITPPGPSFLSGYAQKLAEEMVGCKPMEKTGYTPKTDKERKSAWELVKTRRQKQHSTGNTPGNSPINTPQGSPTGHRRSNTQKHVPGPNPEFKHRHTHAKFTAKNEGAFKDEFEIEIRTINGKPFKGN